MANASSVATGPTESTPTIPPPDHSRRTTKSLRGFRDGEPRGAKAHTPAATEVPCWGVLSVCSGVGPTTDVASDTFVSAERECTDGSTALAAVAHGACRGRVRAYRQTRSRCRYGRSLAVVGIVSTDEKVPDLSGGESVR